MEAHDVTAVLVVWGPGGEEVAVGGENIDGVHVVGGQQLADWLRSVGAGRLSQDQGDLILDALQRFETSRQLLKP